MDLGKVDVWLVEHRVSVLRAVRRDRRWYVGLASENGVQRNGNGASLEAALAHACEETCHECARGTCDRW